MHKFVVTESEMRDAERRAMLSGIDENILIEDAAAAFLHAIKDKIRKSDNIAVIVGGGNNGADGSSIARMLFSYGYKVDLVPVGSINKITVKSRLEDFKSKGGRICDLSEFKCRADLYDIVIDALLGIGLNRDLEGDILEVVKVLGNLSCKIISVDIPSGLGANDGKVYGAAIKADLTVAFGAFKYGHFLGSGQDYCGRLLLENMGIPIENGIVLCEKDVPKLPTRNKVSHKGDYGKIYVLGGSKTMVGAPLLTAESAMANGAGLVTLCVADSLREMYGRRVKESTLKFLPDTDGYMTFDRKITDEIIARADVIAFGMGMGDNPQLPRFIEYIAHNFGGVFIIDADGLNALCGRLDLLENCKCRLILTPHRGEFFRLFGRCEESEVVKKTTEEAKRYNAVIVNKSNVTLITGGKKVYLNAVGGPCMAKGGSGDALVGAIAAYAARMGALEGAAKACYIMGLSALSVAKKDGEDSVLASDTIKECKNNM